MCKSKGHYFSVTAFVKRTVSGNDQKKSSPLQFVSACHTAALNRTGWIYTADRLLLQFYFQECYLKRSAVGVIAENTSGVQYGLCLIHGADASVDTEQI